ncbi:MAG: hypothetical protein IT281_09765 [Ignavibacteria bacterium]|nr:hypothetical protein [Ignavibacteria bacterium]
MYSLLIDDCGWEDASWSTYSWSRIKASEAVVTSPKAPVFDHTLNNAAGSYEH